MPSRTRPRPLVPCDRLAAASPAPGGRWTGRNHRARPRRKGTSRWRWAALALFLLMPAMFHVHGAAPPSVFRPEAAVAAGAEHVKVILAQGIDSHAECGRSSGYDGLRDMLTKDAKLKDADIYDFSYGDQYCPGNKSHRGSYSPAKTCGGVADRPDGTPGAATLLERRVQRVLKDDPEARIVLVGHSLGGLVVSYWAARKDDGFLRTHVKAVVTLDSMVSDGIGTAGVDRWLFDRGNDLAKYTGGELQQVCEKGSRSWDDIANEQAHFGCGLQETVVCAIKNRPIPLTAVVPVLNVKSSMIGQWLAGAWQVVNIEKECSNSGGIGQQHGCSTENAFARARIRDAVTHEIIDLPRSSSAHLTCDGKWTYLEDTDFTGGMVCGTSDPTPFTVQVPPGRGVQITYGGDLGGTLRLDTGTSIALPGRPSCQPSPMYAPSQSRCYVITAERTNGTITITPNPKSCTGSACRWLWVDTIEVGAPDATGTGAGTGAPATALVRTELVVDISGSMNDPAAHGGTKLQAATASAKTVTGFIEQENAPGRATQQAGLVSFNDVVRDRIPPSADFAAVRATLGALNGGSGTNIYDAIIAAVDAFGASPATSEKRIIILLTDGLQTAPSRSDDDFFAADGPVARAKAAGVAVCTIGFGRPGDFNAALLQRIATDTGCEFHEAGDEDKLQEVYVRLRHASTGDVQGEFHGDVAQDETVPAGAFAVPSGAGQAVVTLDWPGSTLDLLLFDPSGRQVDAAYPGANVAVGPTTVNVVVDRPASGQWTLQVFGRQVSRPREPYHAIASTRMLAVTRNASDRSGRSAGVAVLFGIGMLALVAGTLVVARARLGGNHDGDALHGAAGPSHAWALVTADGRWLPVRPGVLVVGRAPDCDLPLGDNSVSARHLRLVATSGTLTLEDLGSTNGTFVNGVHVTVCPLGPGDIVQVGSVVLRVDQV